MIRLADIKTGDNHRELSTEGIADLAASIKGCGMLQPIGLRKNGKGYLLVWGARRLAALRHLEVKQIEDQNAVIVSRNIPDDELRAVENLHRKELSLAEQIEAVAALIKSGRSVVTIAEHIGYSAQWVARRANLTKLSPTMREEMNNADNQWGFGAGFTLAHWEEIASYPESVQEEMAHSQRGFREDSLDKFIAALRKHYAQRMKSIAWPKDKPYGGMPACDTCKRRTSATEFLFDDLEGDDRCLDLACWQAKQAAVVDDKISKAKAAGGKDLMLVSSKSPWNISNDDKKKYPGIRCANEYEVSAKKGGTPALVIDGARAGETVFVKVNKHSASSVSHKNAGPKTMDEKRAQLQQLRDRLVVAAVRELLDEPKAGMRIPLLSQMCKMAAAFGCDSSGDECDFDNLKDYLGGDNEPVEMLPIAEALWRGVSTRLHMRLHYLEVPGRPNPSEMQSVECICQTCGIDYDKLVADAAVAKPEPKSWK